MREIKKSIFERP